MSYPAAAASQETSRQQQHTVVGCLAASACPLELNRETKASVGGCKQQARPAAFQGPKGKGSEGPCARVGETGRPAVTDDSSDRRRWRRATLTPLAIFLDGPSYLPWAVGMHCPAHSCCDHPNLTFFN
jgi:hypothetical protein